jgi:molybdate transport system substrate-binding protein
MKTVITQLTLITILVALTACKKETGGDAEAKTKKGEEVIVLCGGSMRAVLEELKARYEKISDDKIMTTYGGSGELCVQIENSGKGDLYLCHDPFMPWAHKKKMISKWSSVGSLEVVIIVPKGNPKGLKTLKDLAKPGVRLGIGNQDYSTSGQILKCILKQASFGDDILKNVRVETKGHQSRCNDVVMGTLDAAVVWNAVAQLYSEKAEIFPIETKTYDAITSATYDKSELDYTKVTLGIISGSKDRKAVNDFYDFVTTEGPAVFKEFGFSPVRK